MDQTIVTQKRCTKCKEIKIFNDFNVCTAKPDGRSSACRLCNQVHWRKTHPKDRTEAPDLPGEIWKPCEDTRYAVSNLGRVKRITPGVGTHAGRLHKQHPDEDGYMRVIFGGRNTGRTTHLVNQLVCRAFHGEPPTGFNQTKHIDTDRKNNRADNLEWSNAIHNINHRDKMGHTRRGEKHGNARLKDADIPVIDTLLASGLTMKHIGERFGVGKHVIWNVKHRKWWKHIPRT